MSAPADSAAQAYDASYEGFDASLISMREVKARACGEDIGQRSWVAAADLRADVLRLRLSETMVALARRGAVSRTMSLADAGSA